MRPLRIAVHGISGKMGQEILSIIKEVRNDHYYLCASFDQNITSKSFESYTLLQNWAKQKPQVVIDFSAPKGLLEIANWCVKHKCPLVTGTTGLNVNQLKSLKAVAKKIPVFFSPNMSIGVEAVRRGLETMISYLGPCDVAIEDVHHKHKKDSPSGTALMLKNTLVEKRKRGQEIMEPVSLRGGEVYGIHKVYFFSSGEVITIEHQAQNRNIFARGALDAARWLVKQKNGFYSFTDIQRGSN